MSTVVLITGANRGIGLAFARLFSKRPNHVVIGACRNVKDTEVTRDLKREGCFVIELDVSSDESCNKLPEQLKELQIDHVDILINNAGVGMYDDLSVENITEQAMLQFNVNALGPLRVTRALLPFLKRSPTHQPKVVNLSSKMGALSGNLSGRYYGYRASKAAENMISLSLARDLAKDNVVCLLINPGLIRTQMNNNNGDMDADEAVDLMIQVVDSGKLEDGDKFFNRDGKLLDW